MGKTPNRLSLSFSLCFCSLFSHSSFDARGKAAWQDFLELYKDTVDRDDSSFCPEWLSVANHRLFQSG